ncbi:hypothetical protein [Hymenobacter rigui]|nr:hypothetical protein [Hymenobacter rigui]
MRNLLVWLGYVAVFVLFTWPLSQHPATGFPVVPGHDSYQFYWNVWHFRHALEAGTSPWYTTWLFYPEGSWLIMHAYIPIVGMLAVVVRNEMLAINLALLLSYSLSGLGAYLLARRWVRLPLLCVLAGFIFAFSPYKMQRLPEHYNLVLTATVPFYVLYFLRAFRFRVGSFLPEVVSWKAVATCVGLGLITLLSDYYVLFGLLYFSAFYAAWFGLRIGQINWRSRRVWLGLVVLFTVSHISIRLLRLAGVPENGLWWAGDLVAYLLPPPTSRWLDFDWSHRLYNSSLFNAPGSLEITLFVGYLLPLLVLLSWRYRIASALRQDAAGRPLMWVLLLFSMLTVPTLRLYGHERLNLPTAFIHFVPFINNIRCPTRWVLYISLLLPLVCFSSLEAGWFGRWPRGLQYAAGLVLAVGLGVEFWPKPYVRATAADVPAVYRYVANLPGESLISVPFGVQDGNRQIGLADPEQFLYQRWHQKKLLGGYLSRVKPERFAAVEDTPFLRALTHYQAHSGSEPNPPLSQAQVTAFLQRYRPAAFVLPPAFRQQAVHRFLRQALQPHGYQEKSIEGYVLLIPNLVRPAGPSAAAAVAAPANSTRIRYTEGAAARWR